MKQSLFEYQNPGSMSTEISESVDPVSGQKKKDLYMKGICVQGEVRNHNGRIYPISEIRQAVENINALINDNFSVYGELSHPDNLTINLERASHVITSMWMEGADGYGKLKVLPTPMGNIVRALLESQCKVGVSSRGSGNVNESTGHVSDFEIVTIDAVGQASAPAAYPQAVYEGLMNMRGGRKAYEIAADMNHDPKVQKYLKEHITRLISELKLK